MRQCRLTLLLSFTVMIAGTAHAVPSGPSWPKHLMDRVRAAMLSTYFYAHGLDKAAPPLPLQPIKLVKAGEILRLDMSPYSSSRRRRFVTRIGAAAAHELDHDRRKLLIDALKAVGPPNSVIQVASSPASPMAVSVQTTEVQIGQLLDQAPGAVNLFARACCSCTTKCSVSKPQNATDLARVDFVVEVGRTSEELAVATDPLGWEDGNPDYFKKAYYAGVTAGLVAAPPPPVPEPVSKHGDKWQGILFEHVESDTQHLTFMVQNLLRICTLGLQKDPNVAYRLDYGLHQSIALKVTGAGALEHGLTEDCGYAVVSDSGEDPPKMILRGNKEIQFPQLQNAIGLEQWLPMALDLVADEIAVAACCGGVASTGSCRPCASEGCDSADHDVLNTDTRLCKGDPSQSCDSDTPD